ncbi:MAG: hypothetical protein ACYTFZ_06635 [Planctomycetota bacterium]|jgi:hypothetical protein
MSDLGTRLQQDELEPAPQDGLELRRRLAALGTKQDELEPAPQDGLELRRRLAARDGSGLGKGSAEVPSCAGRAAADWRTKPGGA